MSPIFLIFATIIFFVGLSLTALIIGQEDRQTFKMLIEYLGIHPRSSYRVIEVALQSRTEELASQGIRILDKLEGISSLADRETLKEALGKRAPLVALPAIFITPCREKEWWDEFDMQWNTLRRYATKGLSAARRHAVRS